MNLATHPVARFAAAGFGTVSHFCRRHPALVPVAAVAFLATLGLAAAAAWAAGVRSPQDWAALARRLLTVEQSVSETRRMAFDGRGDTDTKLIRGAFSYGLSYVRSAWELRRANAPPGRGPLSNLVGACAEAKVFAWMKSRAG